MHRSKLSHVRFLYILTADRLSQSNSDRKNTADLFATHLLTKYRNIHSINVHFKCDNAIHIARFSCDEIYASHVHTPHTHTHTHQHTHDRRPRQV